MEVRIVISITLSLDGFRVVALSWRAGSSEDCEESRAAGG